MPHKVDLGDGGTTLGFPIASWQARLALCYHILELAGDELGTAIRSWAVMRKAALNRGIVLGGLIDFASQVSVGSIRNLNRIG